jgi:hypothetical protein
MIKRNNTKTLKEDSMQGLDADGKPVTIDAAQKLYHRNDNPLYFPKKNYTS